MVIYEHIYEKDGRPVLPVEKVEEWPESFIPPLQHCYKNITINCGFTPPIRECTRCERTACVNCYEHCPWCGGKFDKKEGDDKRYGTPDIDLGLDSNE